MASRSLSSCRGHLLLVLGLTQHLAHKEELPPHQPSLPSGICWQTCSWPTHCLPQKLHTLASSSAASGAQGLQDLVAAGAHGTAPQNLARDVLRTCTRSSPWPAPYFANIPVMNKATRQDSLASIPFLLPHEMLEVIAQTNPENMEAFVAANIQEPQLKATATEWAAMFGIDMNMIIILGLHGDGVPFA